MLQFGHCLENPCVGGSIPPRATKNSVLNEIPTKFARAVAAVRDEKEKQAA